MTDAITDISVSQTSVSPQRRAPAALPDSGPHPLAEAVPPHVLVVDDESLIADSIAAILNRSGYHAVARYRGLDAIQYFAEFRPAIVVTDVILPDLDGVHVAQAIRALSCEARVILFSGSVATENLLDISGESQSFELLSKPVHPVQLLKLLKA